jgi:hypothetical protein
MKTILCVLALLVLTASTALSQPYYGGGYYGGYGPYGWGGRVPGGYYGVYPYPYVTGRPTLLPQYYPGNYGAYPYGGYPSGYYGRYPWGGPTRYYGW